MAQLLCTAAGGGQWWWHFTPGIRAHSQKEIRAYHIICRYLSIHGSGLWTRHRTPHAIVCFGVLVFQLISRCRYLVTICVEVCVLAVVCDWSASKKKVVSTIVETAPDA